MTKFFSKLILSLDYENKSQTSPKPLKHLMELFVPLHLSSISSSILNHEESILIVNHSSHIHWNLNPHYHPESLPFSFIWSLKTWSFGVWNMVVDLLITLIIFLISSTLIHIPFTLLLNLHFSFPDS